MPLVVFSLRMIPSIQQKKLPGGQQQSSNQQQPQQSRASASRSSSTTKTSESPNTTPKPKPFEPWVPPHRRTTSAAETAAQDKKRLRELQVDDEFEKLKREMGM